MRVLIKRLAAAKRNKFYIFLKKKHKVIELVAIFKVMGSHTFIRVNYKKLFKVYKRIKFKASALENLSKLYFTNGTRI